MTPHEMVLRARLERVLVSSGAGVHDVRKERVLDRERKTSSNEVRDEEGAWPWREREKEPVSLVFFAC